MSESQLYATFCMFQLHHIGAPVSKPIAPVMYMWRPCCLLDEHKDVVGIDDQGFKKAESTESRSCFHQLWVWIHASAFNEGYGALKFACQNEVSISSKPMDLMRPPSIKLQKLKSRVLGDFRSRWSSLSSQQTNKSAFGFVTTGVSDFLLCSSFGWQINFLGHMETFFTCFIGN